MGISGFWIFSRVEDHFTLEILCYHGRRWEGGKFYIYRYICINVYVYTISVSVRQLQFHWSFRFLPSTFEEQINTLRKRESLFMGSEREGSESIVWDTLHVRLNWNRNDLSYWWSLHRWSELRVDCNVPTIAFCRSMSCRSRCLKCRLPARLSLPDRYCLLSCSIREWPDAWHPDHLLFNCSAEHLLRPQSPEQ